MYPSSFTSFFTGLVALLLFSTCSFSLPPPALLTLWVNSTGGADGVGCGTTNTLPCKTLNYTLQRAYEEQTDGNVTILVQANIEKESIVLLAYELGIIIQPDVGIGSVNIEECNITILSGVYFYDVNFESTNFTGWQVWFDRVTAFASTFLCNTVDSGTLEGSFLSVNSSLIQNSTMASHSLSISFCTLQNSPVSTLSCTEVCLVGETYLRSSSFTNTLNASAVTFSPLSSGQVYVDDCTFAENSAVSGGALSVADDVMLVLSSSHVTQNSAAKGGGIYVAGSLMLKNTDVMTNIAESGGGIYVDTMGALLCADSRILDNTAHAKGGGVYVDQGSSFTSINTHGCLLSGNTAQFGGGLHAQSAHIDNTYMTFISNTAHGDGGGFFATNSKVSFEGTTFMSNVAGGRGGGVACVEDCEGNFTDCAFTGNDATVDGGAVFATDSTLVIGASVRSNHAGARGGGLLAIDCLIGFAGASFTNNTASGNNSGAFASDVFLEKSSRNLKKWVLSVSGPDAIVCDDCPAFCPAANNCTDCDPTGNYCVSMDDQAMCAPNATCQHGGTCKIVTQTQVTCTCGKYRDSTDLCREYEFPIIYVYAGLGAIAGLLLLTVAITAIRLQLKKRNQYQILINE